MTLRTCPVLLLLPFDPNKVLEGLCTEVDAQGTIQSAPEPLSAPTPMNSSFDVFATPMKSSDLVSLQKALLESECNLVQQSIRMHCEKVCKAMDLAFARIVALEEQNSRLKTLNHKLQS